MANKDRNKRSARKARAAERTAREAAQATSAPAASGKSSSEAKTSVTSKVKAKATSVAPVTGPKKTDVKKAEAKKAETKKAAPKKQSWFGRLIARITGYFSAVRTEMRRVTWPSKEELKNYSVAVIIMLAVFGVAIWAIDTGVVAGLAAFASLRG